MCTAKHPGTCEGSAPQTLPRTRVNLEMLINRLANQHRFTSGLGGLVVSALDFQAGYRRFSGRDNFQTISTPSSYSTCPGLSIKWTGRRLVINSGTKCAWVIHESKAVQIHVHNNRCCLYVPRVPGSVNPCPAE